MAKLKFLASYQIVATIMREVTVLTNNNCRLICLFSHNNLALLLKVTCKTITDQLLWLHKFRNSINSICKTYSLQRTQVLNSKTVCNKTFKPIKCTQDKSNKRRTIIFNKQISIFNKTPYYNTRLIKTFKS